MKVLMLLVGIAIGLVAARTSGGRAVLDAATGSLNEFVQTVSDSYRARLAESGVG
ncbi:hypothetical protein [uncultured Amnibacterium sp.]|uniref:hypothetical protein n=1 Tax=uncultured Amnibacterium sp. TaxID=1631851 RepID=UPI0035CA624B